MPRPIKLNAASALVLRGNTYWFQKQVPKALREAVGKTRWRFTLSTTDRAVALQKAQLFLDEVQQQLLETTDPSSAYFVELAKLRGASREDAEFIMDTTYPELNEADAPKFYAARSIAQDKAPPAELFTFGAVARDYFKRKPNKERQTTVALNTWGLNDAAVSSISRKQVGDIIDRRLETCRVGTVRADLSHLNCVYRHAERLGIVEFQQTTVFQRWTLEETEKRRTEPMPTSLYKALHDRLGDDRWPMVVSRLSGMRPSECCDVRLETIDGVHCMITQKSKTEAGRDRVVPLHDSLLPIIDDIMPLLTPLHLSRASKKLIKWKIRKYEPFCQYDRHTNLYSCRVSALTEMAAAPEELRMAIAGHRSVHGGYINRYDVSQLKAVIDLIRDPLEGTYAQPND